MPLPKLIRKTLKYAEVVCILFFHYNLSSEYNYQYLDTDTTFTNTHEVLADCYLQLVEEITGEELREAG